MRAVRMLAVAGLVGSGLVTAGTTGGAAVAADAELGWCATSPAPCIVSATREGATVTASDPAWGVGGTSFTRSGSRTISFHVENKAGPDPFELGPGALDDRWVITLDTGTLVPRVVTGHGKDATTTRTADGDGTYHLTVRATPVLVVEDCHASVWPWTCDTTATKERIGYLDGQVTDYGTWTDVAQRNAMYGLDYWTDITVTSVPPEIVPDLASGEELLLVRMAAPHFRTDGTTLFKGSSELRIPNAFLKESYGIPNPATMTGVSLAPVVSGGVGTIRVSQSAAGDAMLVDVEDVTFSTRVLRVRRGTIVPTRPTNGRAVRVAPHRGRVAFTKSRPRGAKVIGYRARCVAVRGTHVVTATKTVPTSPVVVRKLRSGRAYDCKVRATSRAGASPWSTAVRMRARP
ncbi:MAG TPA: fibronectin type III domain-containing protein [Nocardioidaceae bacterium]|nr:fibronectin type III domain-containing protein [Nocardioidaceae bacterium]